MSNNEINNIIDYFKAKLLLKTSLPNDILIELYRKDKAIKITKDSLREFLNEYKALKKKQLCLESNLFDNSISQMYNAYNANMTIDKKIKLLDTLNKYGGNFKL